MTEDLNNRNELEVHEDLLNTLQVCFILGLPSLYIINRHYSVLHKTTRITSFNRKKLIMSLTGLDCHLILTRSVTFFQFGFFKFLLVGQIPIEHAPEPNNEV